MLPLCDLLPHSFGPLDLTREISAPDAGERHNGLRFAPASIIPGGIGDATDGASTPPPRSSRSPRAPRTLRTARPRGLALVDDVGACTRDTRLSLRRAAPARRRTLHAALVAAVGSAGMGDANGGEWGRIKSATLVEMSGAPVQYAGTVGR